jgi:hypothetical protein
MEAVAGMFACQSSSLHTVWKPGPHDDVNVCVNDPAARVGGAAVVVCTHADRSKNMNSSAFSCGVIGLIWQACGNDVLLSEPDGSLWSPGGVQRPGTLVPPLHVAWLPSRYDVQFVFPKQPVQNPAVQISPPVHCALVAHALLHAPVMALVRLHCSTEPQPVGPVQM